jgi:hypothetical protein
MNFQKYLIEEKQITIDGSVFHKSNPKFRDKISVEGLKAKFGQQRYGEYIKDKTPAIFASLKINKLYDSTYDDDVWKIDTTKITNKWYADKNFEWMAKNPFVVTYENIPPEAISLIHKGTGNEL